MTKMGARALSNACHRTAVVFPVLFLWAFCLNASTGVIICPPAQESAAYNITVEIYNLGDLNVTAAWFYGTYTTAFANCYFSTLSCVPVLNGYGFFYKMTKLENEDFHMVVGTTNFISVLQQTYSVEWNYGGKTFRESCAVTIGGPVNECFPVSPCVNATECLDLPVGYQCSCSEGFYGANCNTGDLILRCESSMYPVRLTQGADNCVEVNNSCSVAGLDYNTRMDLAYMLVENNGSSVLQVTQYISEKTIFVNVCTTSVAEITTYQIIYALQSPHSKTSFPMKVLVEVEKGNTPPRFNSPANGAPYTYDVPEDTGPQETTIVTVMKSLTLTCNTSSCIQVIDPDTNPNFGIDSLTLSVEPEGQQDVSVQYMDTSTDDSLGYFYSFGQLTATTEIQYTLVVTDGGHASATATVIFNISDVNEPPKCSTTEITRDMDLRTQPESLVGAVLCYDDDVEATFQKIDYAITGTHADYFNITDNGRIFLSRAVAVLDPGQLNLTVIATGYSAAPEDNYVIRIPVTINLTAPEPKCSLTVKRTPDIWMVNAVAELQLECETWGLDKLRIVSWAPEDSFNVSVTKQSPTVLVLTLSVRMNQSLETNFEVKATLGGKPTSVMIHLSMYNRPVFALNKYNVTIQETLPIGGTIIILSATSSDNNALIYRITSGDNSSLFTVDSIGGLSATRQLHPFGGSTFHLVCEVMAFPSGLTATTDVEINVMDINEAPVCSDPGSVAIKSNLPPQRIVTNILCQDPDNLPEYKTLSYSLINYPSSVLMDIGNNGSIALRSLLPVAVTSIEVFVNVSDSGGLSAHVHFHILITAITCPRETAQFDLTFPETPVNSEITLNCTGKHSGQIIRSCFLNETWGPFNYNNCSNEGLKYIITQLANWIANSSLSVEEVEEKLKTVAGELVTTLNESSSVLPADIKQTVEIFNKVAKLALSRVASLDKITVQRFVSSADVIFGVNDNVWMETNKSYEAGAMMLQAMDSIVTAGLRDEHDVGQDFVTMHIVIATAVSSADIYFSSYNQAGHENGSDLTVQSNIKAVLAKKVFSPGAVKYSVVLYRNLTDKLQINPNRQRGVLRGKILNSDVLTFVLNVSMEVLVPPLQLTFSVLQPNYSRPSCGYLDTHASDVGVWATEGCATIDQGDTVQCSCNHLTNFAILMSPSGDKYISSADKTALSIISAVGCGISMFCLVITVMVYMSLWKYVKCDRSVLHVNLSVCLFLAYIVFIVGVDRTDSKIGCKVVAALLHYLFLVVFFIMLSEGIEIFKSVSFVFSSDSILGKLIPLSYGVPLVIVAVSLGVTRTEGYGGETSCWLSTTGGLIWAFVGPVLLVFLINCIILIQVLRIMQKTKQMMTKTAQEKTKSVVRTICLLSPMLGLTWVFGVLSINKGTIIFQYLFAIFNSLQGLFIFICYCLLTHQVRNGFRELRRKHRAKSFDSMAAKTSSTAKLTDSKTISTRLKNSNSNTHTTTTCESPFSEARPETELHKRPNRDGSNDVNPPVIGLIPLGSTDPPTRDSRHQFSLRSSDPVRSNGRQTRQTDSAGRKIIIKL